ncbi:MAG: hypothetical protein PF795_02980 [Kiritimatiellae bacterium]|nr:hypothetical protein [Kiritimatiellia bacterium]
MTNVFLLRVSFCVLSIVSPVFADSFALEDGSTAEGSIHRIEGRKIIIMSSTGVQTYDVMEFDANTRNQHFQRVTAQFETTGTDPSRGHDAEMDDQNNEQPWIQIHSPLLDSIRFYSAFPMLGFGLLLCFFGRRFYRQLMTICGVVLGLGIGWLIAVQWLKVDNLVLSGLIMLGSATLLGFLFLTYVYLIVILFGAVFGLTAVFFILLFLKLMGIESDVMNKSLLFFLPALGGILAITHFKIMILLMTASMGGNQVVNSLFVIGVAVMNGSILDAPETVISHVQALKENTSVTAGLLLAYSVVFVSGIFVQLKQSPPKESTQ